MLKMYECHVPIESYGFISVHIETANPEDAVEAYREIAELAKPHPVNEMPKKDFDAVLDDLLEDNSIKGDPGMCEQMSPVQNEIIQAIKRSIKRRNNK